MPCITWSPSSSGQLPSLSLEMCLSFSSCPLMAARWCPSEQTALLSNQALMSKACFSSYGLPIYIHQVTKYHLLKTIFFSNWFIPLQGPCHHLSWGPVFPSAGWKQPLTDPTTSNLAFFPSAVCRGSECYFWEIQIWAHHSMASSLNAHSSQLTPTAFLLKPSLLSCPGDLWLSFELYLVPTPLLKSCHL